ncbi:MAG: nucleotidyltransferase family protein [Clostridia bacterium]|nr:nucleotidyltransferase family protein [Clostridia bacterium]
MRVAGVVCEYNPFHAGHRYHLAQTRAGGADVIAAVMSGNFVQRGDPAMTDKWRRAAAAVRCGADLVIDLPVPWATGSARDFASGAVALLSAVGADVLSFGCETDDTAALKALAAVKDRADVQTGVKRLTADGLSYPAALEQAVRTVDPRAPAELLRCPNSVLALEYLSALERLHISMDVMAIRRTGAAHDAPKKAGGFLSAAAIRALPSLDAAKPFIPPEAFAAMFPDDGGLTDRAAFETLLLGVLRRMSAGEVAALVDDRSGLADRITDAARTACTLDELYAAAKTKSVTMAKVKRELLHVLLGVAPGTAQQTPPYLRVLAANERGLALLKDRRPALPVMTRHADFARADGFTKAVYDMQCVSTDLYLLTRKQKRPCGEEQRHSVILMEN